MPIKPKHTVNMSNSAREFTDRVEYFDTFKKFITHDIKKEYSILSFYGVGGIGKSSLRKEFGKLLNSEFKEIVWTYLDFELPAFRETETALYHLRKSLKEKNNVDFPAFDIAYTVFWQKTHPQLALTKEKIPFIDEGSILSSLLSSASGIPLVGLLPSIAQSAYKGHKQIKNWWIKRGQKELYDLPSLSPKEILEKLPLYFSLDLKDHLKEKSLNAVIFVDTYEALWENHTIDGGFFERDEWLRELVAQLPGVHWVFFGREKLRWSELDADWDNYIEKHLMGSLSDSDSEAFLDSCGIGDEKIKKIIVNSSKGVPYYLDLAADTYYQIKDMHHKEPEIKDFAKTQKKVLARFLKYLDQSEIETLKLLSLTRYWDTKIFRILVNEFKTGYPLTAMNVLCRFSFIEFNAETGTYRLHDLIRQGLLNLMADEVKKSASRILFEYYAGKIPLKGKEINDEHCIYFNEAFFHAKHFLEISELRLWFHSVSPGFNDAAKWKALKPAYEELINMLQSSPGKNSEDFAELIIYFSSVLYNLGEYQKALETIEANMKSLNKILKEDDPRYSSLLNNLATIYYYRGEMKKSKEIYEKVMVLRKKILGENHRHYADVIDNLGVIFNNTGEHNKAVELHKKAAEIYKNVLGESHVHYADALNNLASGYLSLKKYDDAAELYIKSKDIVIKAVGKSHPRYASSLHNLAHTYLLKQDYKNALTNNLAAYRLRCKLLGETHPSTAVSLSDLAHIYQQKGDFERAMDLHSEAIEIFRNTVGERHFNYADSLFSIGECYIQKNEKSKAEEMFNKSLEIYVILFGDKHEKVIETKELIKSLV